MRPLPSSLVNPSSDRRRFVKGLAAGATLAVLGDWPVRVLAQAGQVPELRGMDFDLDIAPAAVNFTGKPRLATAINGSVPGPTLRWRQGERVTLRVTNRLNAISSLHWHGIILPVEMDGVPGLSFDGIPPQSTFVYEFRVQQAGTYWYHSHSGFQEQTGMYGAIVIEASDPEPFSFDRDYVVMLSDWTDEDPMRVFSNLKKDSHYYNYRKRTLADIRQDIREAGWAQTRRDRRMWNQMRMSDRDLADVTGQTYTFLMNGLTPADNWTAPFRRGERVRLRFINGSAMTYFDVRIPGLEMTVVAADGQNIEPVTVDEFRMAVAETYDVIVAPRDDRAYTLLAQAIDRSGYARGTLTPDPALTADVPELDPAPRLGHMDMAMGSMEQAAMDHATAEHEPVNSAADAGHAGMDHAAAEIVTHDPSERGPGVAMRAESPRAMLDDPGIGLRDRPWRVLSYADLRHLGPGPDPREPEREIELHLTGNMERYMWSFDGVRFSLAEPIRARYNERLSMTLVNDTMMNHPIHLHGMWSDVETGDDRQLPRKHTVNVQPGQTISFRVTANASGRWAFHCHLIYHMEAGMFRVVEVS
ncbi:copper resistance system multicopper oxidase [Candidatus Rariloculus sp.]|uniref:copper resistance system multicopper oxidase n=1 Tax=Candidatus Rariloculus sp. TaxID=3101265 RepID=UPI003D0A5AB6